MGVKEAIDAIRDIDSTEELNAVVEAIKLKRNWITMQTRRSLMLGDTVQFYAGPRRGGTLTGKVVKINIKKVKVKVTDGTTWSVPADMLTPVQDTVSN